MSGGPMSDLEALNKWLGEQKPVKTTVDKLHDKDVAEILTAYESKGYAVIKFDPQNSDSVKHVHGVLKSIFGE